MKIGIPYAFSVLGKNNVVECPVCKIHIELKQKKDFESNSINEYAEHYKKEHNSIDK